LTFEKVEYGVRYYYDNNYCHYYSHYILTCDDLDNDECAEDNGGCHSLATCTNVPGTRTCACLTGCIGDGFICTGKAVEYVC